MKVVRRREACAAAFIMALPLIGLGYLTSLYISGHRFYDAYQQIEFDMSEQDLKDLFGRNPDYICHFRCFTIVYFCRSKSFLPDQKSPVEAEVQSEIPYVYDAAQIALGPDGRVSAFNHNGEEHVTHTREQFASEVYAVAGLPEEFFACPD